MGDVAFALGGGGGGTTGAWILVSYSGDTAFARGARDGTPSSICCVFGSTRFTVELLNEPRNGSAGGVGLGLYCVDCISTRLAPS